MGSPPADDGAGASTQLPVQIRRSARRRRTVSAVERDGVLLVMLPAGMSAEEERSWVTQMQARWAKRQQVARARHRRSDEELMRRAGALSSQYLGGRARPTSVRWVGNQQHRWGSCTPSTGAIRLSTSLRPMPTWVQDYVLLHELAHLLVPGHGPPFWALLQSYQRTERARGYLEGVAAARGLPTAEADAADEPELPGSAPARDEEQ